LELSLELDWVQWACKGKRKRILKENSSDRKKKEKEREREWERERESIGTLKSTENNNNNCQQQIDRIKKNPPKKQTN